MTRNRALHLGPSPVNSRPSRLPTLGNGEDALWIVARAMLAARTDAVPVVDDDGRLVGLVTARQCVELVAGRAVM
jgi:hypothetical protein